ncbi:hypothetical protein NQZ68_012718 [Dissostichus eleginoides]|nr:hypothetical protein NQZ68_012718 [Dissostichus eleginoides]
MRGKRQWKKEKLLKLQTAEVADLGVLEEISRTIVAGNESQLQPLGLNRESAAPLMIPALQPAQITGRRKNQEEREESIRANTPPPFLSESIRTVSMHHG